MREMEIDSLSAEIRELYFMARDVSQRAYAPYSNFRVGAALLTGLGGIFCGVNVESASYGLTCCAEKSAIVAAVTTEGPKMRIQQVAVHVTGEVAVPCGACRQMIAEFGTDVRIVFSARDRVVDSNLAELLPLHFVAPDQDGDIDAC